MAASIGEQLRLAREERGIGLREICEQTRISVHYLEAIEANDYKRLPGGDFVVNFVTIITDGEPPAGLDPPTADVFVGGNHIYSLVDTGADLRAALLENKSCVAESFLCPRHELYGETDGAVSYAMNSNYAGSKMVKGKPGVVLTHLGPGLTNAATGVANAALDSIPMVVIAGDIPSYFYGRHPHQEVNLHQDADQFEIFRPFCKRVYRVDRVEDLTVRKAVIS